MKKTLFICFLAVAAAAANAQGVEKRMGTSASASQIYLEVGGSAAIYSLNFDSRFKKQENGLGFRIGAGGAGGSGSGYFAVPAQLNYLLGENGKYLELGAGATFLHVTGDDDFFFDNSASSLQGNLVVGFRSQPFAKKGITWRVAFTPFVGSEGFLPFGGASIGYRF
jgi:opacity protein-like surface antigen